MIFHELKTPEESVEENVRKIQPVKAFDGDDETSASSESSSENDIKKLHRSETCDHIDTFDQSEKETMEQFAIVENEKYDDFEALNYEMQDSSDFSTSQTKTDSEAICSSTSVEMPHYEKELIHVAENDLQDISIKDSDVIDTEVIEKSEEKFSEIVEVDSKNKIQGDEISHIAAVSKRQRHITLHSITLLSF